MSTTVIAAAAGSVAANNAAMAAAIARDQRVSKCQQDPQCEVLVVQQCNEYGAIEYGFAAFVWVVVLVLVFFAYDVIRSVVFER